MDYKEDVTKTLEFGNNVSIKTMKQKTTMKLKNDIFNMLPIVLKNLQRCLRSMTSPLNQQTSGGKNQRCTSQI